MSTATRKRDRAAATLLATMDIDPAVQKVHKDLERTVAAFMSSVGELCRNYDGKLQAALPFNPKAKFFSDEEARGDELSSPAPAAAIARPSTPLLKPRTPGSAAPSDLAFPTVVPATPKASKAADKGVVNFDIANVRLLAQLRVIKGEARTLAKMFDQIHDWVALNIPRMDDADAEEGVEIIGMVLENVTEFNELVRSVCGLEAKYLSDRADLEEEYAKFPESVSSVKSFEVLDSNTWDDVERGWRGMIRTCLLLHSTLQKNMKWLRDPRRVESAGKAPGLAQ